MTATLAAFMLIGTMPASSQEAVDTEKMAKISFINGMFQGESVLNAGSTEIKAPTKAQGKPVLKGRYYEVAIQYEIPGMPTDGKIMVAYDSALKVYKSWWFDSLSATPIIATGKFEAANLVFTSEPTAIGGGATTAIVRTTWKPSGPNLAYEVEFKTNDTWTTMVKVNLARAQIQPPVQP